jgi:hypothetical protein
VVIPAVVVLPIATANGHAAGTPAQGAGGQPAPTDDPPSKYPGHVKTPYRTGRKADRRTEEMLEFCYDLYILDRQTRTRVFEKAKSKFRDDAPNTEKDVAVYARRWAGRFSPALPIDRDGPGVTELRSAMARRGAMPPRNQALS